MLDKVERPFVCDGSPLQTQMFVVGLNPATALRQNFWCFWDDSRGFDREKFDREYREVRAMKTGNRPRIEAISRAFPRGLCLETNIYSSPTKTAPMLRRDQKRTEAFEFLFRTIQPKALYIHGAPVVQFFTCVNAEIGGFDDDTPIRTRLWDHAIVVMLRRRRALYTASCEAAHEFGRALAASV
jgi:hypothetical protein